jgi:hypothetical protein
MLHQPIEKGRLTSSEEAKIIRLQPVKADPVASPVDFSTIALAEFSVLQEIDHLLDDHFR